MLEKKGKWVRQKILETTISAQHGHIGGSLSCVEILLALYHGIKRTQDKFILSKGQAAQAIYAVLADLGHFPVEELETFCQEGTRLLGHVTRDLPGIDVTTGSLGNGLGVGAGWALASKMDKIDRNIYVLLGDGECYEGSVWEAAMFASHYKLNNLIAIIDRNKQCVLDYTEDINRLEPLGDKWRAFGWQVKECNGHSIPALTHCLQENTHSPLVVIAHTVKGKGISFMERVIKWHAGVPDEEESKRAKGELWI